MHYASPFNGKVLDYAGVTIDYIEERPPYLAAVYLFVSERLESGIPPRVQNFVVNMSCSYRYCLHALNSYIFLYNYCCAILFIAEAELLFFRLRFGLILIAWVELFLPR